MRQYTSVPVNWGRCVELQLLQGRGSVEQWREQEWSSTARPAAASFGLQPVSQRAWLPQLSCRSSACSHCSHSISPAAWAGGVPSRCSRVEGRPDPAGLGGHVPLRLLGPVPHLWAGHCERPPHLLPGGRVCLSAH